MGAAAAAMALAGTRASAQTPPPTAFQPARHDKDAWFDKIPGTHRMVLDVTSASGVSEALGFANNPTSAVRVSCFRWDFRPGASTC